MTLQILTIFLASLLMAFGVVSLIGLRRLAKGTTVVALSAPIALIVFVVALGTLLYRSYGGG